MTQGQGRGEFRLGVAGAGRMGRTHLAAIAGSELITVAGVAEPDPGAAAAAAAVTGAPVTASLDELLTAGGLDGVLIAVPTDRHLEVAGRVLAAGLPVLCEKPCGLTARQAARCAELAAAAGLPLQVAYWRRFVPELTALRERMLGGEFGEVLAVNCYQWDAAPPPVAFRAASGGIFADMGVHEFDQVRWLTGQEFGPVRVASARPGGGAAGDGDGDGPGDPDCAQLVAELDGGGTALVSLGRWHPAGDICRVEAFGTKGTESIPFLRPEDGDLVFRQALLAQAEDFARSVTTGRAGTGATAADAIAALRIAEQASNR
ncbi:MAG TPA: Gfo/Idh/MocA family oxidoreductase [Streptosporangiaceae bacterium]